jgi:hypothetical protein
MTMTMKTVSSASSVHANWNGYWAIAFLAFSVLIPGLPQNVWAENALRPEFHLTTSGEAGTAKNSRSAIAYNARLDEYMVAHDWEYTPNNRKFISVSRVKDGKSESYFGYISATPDDCESPDIAFDFIHNQYLVVWSQYHGLFNVWAVYGRLIDAEGNGGSDPFEIQLDFGTHYQRPKVAFGYNVAVGSYVYMVVAQSSAKSNGALNGLSAVVFDANGNKPFAPPSFQIDAGPHIGTPDITFNEAKAEFLVVWAEFGGATGIDVMGRRVGMDKSLPAPSFSINSDNNNQQLPAVTTNAQDQYLVLFQHDFYGDGTDWDIRGQFLDVTGAKVRSVFGVGYSTENEKFPSVGSNPINEEYLVTWIEEDATFGDTIRARTLNTAGKSSKDFEVAEGSGGVNRYPGVGDGKNGYFITYSWDANSPAQYGDIYGRLFVPKFPWILFQHLFGNVKK